MVFAELHPAGHYLWPKNAPDLQWQGFCICRFLGAQIARYLCCGGCGDRRDHKELWRRRHGLCHFGRRRRPEPLRVAPSPTNSIAGGFHRRAAIRPTLADGHSEEVAFSTVRDAVPPRLRSEIQSWLPWQLRHWLAFESRRQIPIGPEPGRLPFPRIWRAASGSIYVAGNRRASSSPAASMKTSALN